MWATRRKSRENSRQQEEWISSVSLSSVNSSTQLAIGQPPTIRFSFLYKYIFCHIFPLFGADYRVTSGDHTLHTREYVYDWLCFCV